MSTSFSEITKLISLEMAKSDIFKNDNTDIALDKISDYILIGANVDFTTCRKDLNKYTPFTKFENNFTIDQDCSSYTFDLTNVDILLRDEITMYVNGEEIDESDYSYQVVGDNGEIIYNFYQGDELQIVNLFEGEFEEDLTFREKYIIALGAYYHYVGSLILKEQEFCTKLGDKDYTVVKGNTLTELLKLSNQIKTDLKIYVKQYDDYISEVEEMM